MACNLPRWNWLIEGTYNQLPPIQRGEVMSLFFKRNSNKRDDVALYDCMVELGIQTKGTDPSPPKITLVTQAGADEYEEIMILQETVRLHRKLDKKSTAS